MSRVFEKWYVSLIIIPILLTYLTNYFTIPLLTSDWKIAIIFSLSITVIILLLEIKTIYKKQQYVSHIITVDTETITRLLNTLDVEMFQQDVCEQDSWNGYKQEAIHNIIDYQYATRLVKNRILNPKIHLLFSNFNDKLNKFTSFTQYHVSGHSLGFLVPFKDSGDREKVREDSFTMNRLSKEAFQEFEVLIIFLKKNGYLNNPVTQSDIGSS
ncbi:hypothetical protein [Sphingobacterium multivorum]|uniref:hypothetical protein n=1 Tax=Sphingobacterium multivorum TaxID=28454 RepID=UPI00301A6730